MIEVLVLYSDRPYEEIFNLRIDRGEKND